MDQADSYAPVVHPWRGRLLVIAASLLWSTSGFFVKAPLFDGWEGSTLAFWRSLFAAAVIVFLVRRITWSWRMIPMAIAFGAMCFTYLNSMSLMSGSAAACALWLQCTAPAWVMLVGVLLLGEKADWRDWAQVVLSLCGVAAMVAFRSDGVSLKGVALGLTSGLLYAVIILMLRVLRGHDSGWLSLLNQSVAALMLLPFAWQQPQTTTTTQWLLLAAFGVFQLGLPYLFFSLALKHIPGHEASLIGLIEPLLLPLWILLAWGDRPDAVVFLSGGFILAGMLIKYGDALLPRSPKDAA
jgi:drug/metabolite transporter, DME family